MSKKKIAVGMLVHCMGDGDEVLKVLRIEDDSAMLYNHGKDYPHGWENLRKLTHIKVAKVAPKREAIVVLSDDDTYENVDHATILIVSSRGMKQAEMTGKPKHIGKNEVIARIRLGDLIEKARVAGIL